MAGTAPLKMARQYSSPSCIEYADREGFCTLRKKGTLEKISPHVVLLTDNQVAGEEMEVAITALLCWRISKRIHWMELLEWKWSFWRIF